MRIQTDNQTGTQKTSSAVQQLVHSIKDYIVENNLRTGDKIPNESMLSSMFGKSRGCVREAVQILQSYGVLEVRRGDATYVSGKANKGLFDAQFFRIIANGTSLSELIELRSILEIGILDLSIQQFSEEKFNALKEKEHEFEQSLTTGIDPEKSVQIDRDFHLLLADMTNNEVLKNVYSTLLDLFTPYIQTSHIHQKEKKDYSVIVQHNYILRAIQEKDHDLARYSVKNSLRDWEQWNKNFN